MKNNKLISAVILLAASGTVGATDYTFSTFTEPNAVGVGATYATGINDEGDVVGTYNEGSQTYGFLYSQGVFTTIAVPDALYTEALGINDRRQIVGYWVDTDGLEHGFLYAHGTYTTITYPGSTQGTAAFAINSAGDIVGNYVDASGTTQGFVESRGNFTTIHEPAAEPGGATYATGIDDEGQIVGFYNDGVSNSGFLYSHGVFTRLYEPTAAGPIPFTEAWGINDLGVITGFFDNPANGTGTPVSDPETDGFLYGRGTYSPFSVPGSEYTYIFGINNLGQIVGYYSTGVGYPQGFVATPMYR